MSTPDGAAPTNGASASPTTERLIRRTRERLRQSLRSIVTLVVLLVIAWGASFYFYATNRIDYLTGRALRELMALGTRTDNTLNSALGILQLTRRDDSTIFESTYLTTLSRHLNVRLDSIRDEARGTSQTQTAFRAGWFGRTCVPGSSVKDHPGFYRDSQPGLNSSCLQTRFAFWLKRPPDSVKVRGNAAINVATLLDSVFRYPVNDGVFELVVLADSAGHILLQTGPLPVRLGRLDALPAGTDQAGKPVKDEAGTWQTFRLRPTIVDVNLAGSAFRVFQAPCCLSSAGTWSDRPLVIAGLVRKSTFLLEGLQLPLSLVTVLSAVIVLALLAWPFLKFRLIGERQRIRPSDGLKLGASSLLATALVTVFALAFYGYHQFRDLRDHALERFGRTISRQFTEELVQAYRQLDTLSRWAKTQPNDSGRGDLLNVLASSKDSTMVRFPHFESFALVDTFGKQIRKWSTQSVVQPKVSVRHRRYFQNALSGQTWSLVVPGVPDTAKLDTLRFALEPVRSITTGRHEAVMAVRVKDLLPVGDSLLVKDSLRIKDSLPRKDSLPVAALALDMVSVVGTTLPVGVGFAIIDEEGRVLFHADETRNLEEEFFIETDQNRHLRSAVLGRSAEHMTLTYAGGDYRAYVMPISGLPWTIVTFRDMQPGRVVSAEWVLSSSFLILLYLLVLLLLTGLVVLFVPRTRLSAFWPDRRQRQTYVELIGILLILTIAFMLSIVGLARVPLLLASLILPLLAIVLTVLRLQSRGQLRQMIQARRPGVILLMLSAAALIGGLVIIGGRSDADPIIRVAIVALAGVAVLCVTAPAARLGPRLQVGIVPAYRSVAFLFLLLVGALPAGGFFKVAHTVHTEALVKYQQLELAGHLKPLNRDRCPQGDSGPFCDRTIYSDSLGLVAGPDIPVREPDGRSGVNLVNRLLPLVRLESAVAWSGMYNDIATDSSRAWSASDGSLVLHFPGSTDTPGLSVRTRLPSLGLGDWHWLLLVVMSGLAGLVIWWIVRFVSRHLFLVEMSNPVAPATGNRLVQWPDTNLLLLCRDCEEENRLQFSEHFATLDMSQPSWERDEEIQRIRRSVAEGRQVVLRHFEQQRRDPVVAGTTLRLVDSLVRESAATVVLVESRVLGGGPLGLGEEWNQPLPGESTAGQAVLESFVLVDAARWVGDEVSDKPPRWTNPAASSNPIQRLLTEECRGDRNLQEIWKGLARAFTLAEKQGSPPSRKEMLDLLGEKAEAYYDDIWTSCRRAERVVLGHLAQDGLVNDKDWRVLRRLMVRGLIRRDPQFRVMNETFRRYLVRHVETAEIELGPDFKSVWDNVKAPLMAVVATAIVVLLVTQQGLFDATTSVVMGLSTGIPAFAKVVEFISGRKQAATA